MLQAHMTWYFPVELFLCFVIGINFSLLESKGSNAD